MIHPYEDLNKVVRNFEEALSSWARPFVDTFVRISEGVELGWARLEQAGRFRLVLRVGDSMRPLAECSYAERVEASGFVPPLIDALERVDEDLVHRAQMAMRIYQLSADRLALKPQRKFTNG